MIPDMLQHPEGGATEQIKSRRAVFFRSARLAAFVIIAATIQAALAEPLLIHVSVEGNDRWSGRLAQPNQDRSDGPFATLPRARDEVRRERGPHQLDGIRVFLHSGVYFLDA